MAMQMQRAFNARMMSPMKRHNISVGSYNSDNQWVEGAKSTTTIYGVIQAGNKFSQFDEGQSLHSEDGGARFSDYRTLYVMKKYVIKLTDKIEFKGSHFNVLQRSDEEVFGFYSVLLEKSEDWTP